MSCIYFIKGRKAIVFLGNSLETSSFSENVLKATPYFQCHFYLNYKKAIAIKHVAPSGGFDTIVSISTGLFLHS